MNEYLASTKKCFSLLYKHKQLLLPDFFLAIVTAFFLFGVVYLNDLQTLFTGLESQAEFMLRSLIESTPQFVQLLATGVVAIVVNIWVGIVLVATRLVMVNDVLQKKKTSFLSAYKRAHKYFLKLFLVRFCVLFLVFLAVLLGGVLLYANRSFTIPVVLIGIVFLLFVKLAFLFVDPILIRKKKGVFGTLKAAHQYFMKKSKYTILVLLTTFLVGLAVQVPISVISEVVAPVIVLSFVMVAVTFLANIVVTVWSTLFLFDKY